MSIQDAIKAHCESRTRELRLHVPARQAFIVRRHIFLGADVQKLIDMDSSINAEYSQVSGRANAKLDSISNGGYVTFGMNPHKKKASCLMARIHPVGNGVVDVRLTDPNPRARIFGVFASTDILILLNWAPRGKLDFIAEGFKCRQAWDALFPNHAPLIGNKVEDYVSKHFDIG